MIKIVELESSKGWGGQEKRTVRLINNLSNEFKVYFGVEKESQLYKKQAEINAEFFDIKLDKIYNLATIFKLCSFVIKNRIDIISTHSGKDAWIGNIVGLLTNTKVIRVRHLIVPIKSPLSYNLASKVVTVSKQVEKELIESGVLKSKTTTIYTGVDTTKFKPDITYDLRAELGLDKDTILVAIVAVLRRAKRHHELIETFLKIQTDAKLLIIGDGPQSKNIKELINKHKAQDRVLLLGHREDVASILPNLDIFVLPSEHEALGTSLLEAASCGVVSLGANVGGIPEAIKDGVSGYLFNTFDGLQEKLTTLLKDKALRDTLSLNSRKYIEEIFSTKKMVELTENLYKELAK